MKKGFTLVEMLVVLAVLSIIAIIAVPSIKKVQDDRAVKTDSQTAFMYEKALNAYKTEDYSSAVIYINNDINEDSGKIIGGKATYSDISDLTSAEVEALSKSGKGLYPKTQAGVTGSIKMYGLEIKNPEQNGYAFYFNKNTGEVEIHETGYKVANYICIDR